MQFQYFIGSGTIVSFLQRCWKKGGGRGPEIFNSIYLFYKYMNEDLFCMGARKKREWKERPVLPLILSYTSMNRSEVTAQE